MSCFFLRQPGDAFWKSNRCILDTGEKQSNLSWGYAVPFLELSPKCLDPVAQFSFQDNGALLNLKTQRCLAAFNTNGHNAIASAQNPQEGTCALVTHSADGRLSVKHKERGENSVHSWCAIWRFNEQLYKRFGIEFYVGLTTKCDSIYDTTFVFGKRGFRLFYKAFADVCKCSVVF